MRTFGVLIEAERKVAVEYATTQLLRAILEGGLRFNDKLNGDHLQAKIDRAWRKAESMQTPWFAHEYIMETCKDEIMGMARADAEDSLYSEEERVVSLEQVEATATA